MKKNNQGVKFSVKVDRGLAWNRGGSVRYARAWFRAPEFKAGEAMVRVPKNLAIVLDRSGSMAGMPLDMAKRAVGIALDCCKEGDFISLIVFDSEVRTLCAGRAVDQKLRDEMREVLGKIDAGSQTNLSAGWLLGARCAAEVMERTHGLQSHVLVLSDGQSNEGVQDPVELGQHAAELRMRGLTSSAIGIGEGYSQMQLGPIAEEGGGCLHDAQYPHEILEVVSGEMEGFLGTVVERLELQMRVPEGVDVECLSTYPAHFSSGVLKVTLGMMSAEKERDAIFLVKVPAGKTGDVLEMECRAEWRLAGESKIYSASESVWITFASGKNNTAQPRGEVLAQRVAEVWHASLLGRAVALNRMGHFGEAKEMLSGELERFRRYVEGMSDAERLIEGLTRAVRGSESRWDERKCKEIQLFALATSTARSNSRLLQRMPVESYLPDANEP